MIQPDRWQQVERIYLAALDLEKRLRPAFLSKACDGDADLLREIETLVELATRAEGFLEERAIDVAAREFAADALPIYKALNGRTLSHYQVLDKLGEGGMGIVYKARDTHLDRFVALKILPPESVRDPERRRRFIQEAKAASALNHPNIVTIHDIDSVEGVDFIAMEYVAGRALDSIIGRSGVPLQDALRYAVQVAGALARAHDAGIIHRDVKPANIMVTPEGQTKLLDFGLAKLTEAMPAHSEASTAILSPRTEQGVIAGTIAYMSPEQAEGKAVDARSDIFSFGVVLYEMLAGRRPFTGNSKISVLGAIVRAEPPSLGSVAPGTPSELVRVVMRCLRKDPARRFQHMLDLKVALEELKEESDSGRSPQSRPPRRRWRVYTGAATTVAALTLAGLWFGLRDRPGAATTPPASPLTSFKGLENDPAFSPDGKQIAFVWGGEKGDNNDIYVMHTTGGQPLRLTTDPAADADPVWSPDAAQIAFSRGGAIHLISSLGGPETRLTTAHCRGLDWSSDSHWLSFPDRDSPGEPCSIYLLSPATRERRRLLPAERTTFGDCEPAFSPDGRTIVFVRQRRSNAHELWLQSLSGGPARKILGEDADIHAPAWLPGGSEIVYASDVGGFWRIWRIAAEGGAPRAVPNTADGRSLDISRTTPMRLAFSQQPMNIDIWRMSVDGGPPRRIIASTRSDWSPRYSFDGSKLAFMSDRQGAPALWLADADGSHQRPLLSEFLGGTPQWSPDDSRIAYDVKGNLVVINADGGGRRLLTQGPAHDARPTWSHDSSWIYFRSNRSSAMQIWKIPAQGGTPLQVTRGGAWEAVESPDGELLYFVRDRFAPGLWSMPVSGGAEQLVAPDVRISWWAPAGHDIHFVNFSVKPPAVQQMNTKTRAVRTLRTVEDLWPDFSPSFSVSPDGRWLAWSLDERLGSDLMLIDNFK